MERSEKIGASLSKHRSDGAGIGGKFELAASHVYDVNSRGEGAWQVPPNEDRQRVFAAAPRVPLGKDGIGGEDLLERRHRSGSIC